MASLVLSLLLGLPVLQYDRLSEFASGFFVFFDFLFIYFFLRISPVTSLFDDWECFFWWGRSKSLPLACLLRQFFFFPFFFFPLLRFLPLMNAWLSINWASAERNTVLGSVRSMLCARFFPPSASNRSPPTCVGSNRFEAHLRAALSLFIFSQVFFLPFEDCRWWLRWALGGFLTGFFCFSDFPFISFPFPPFFFLTQCLGLFRHSLKF